MATAVVLQRRKLAARIMEYAQSQFPRFLTPAEVADGIGLDPMSAPSVQSRLRDLRLHFDIRVDSRISALGFPEYQVYPAHLGTAKESVWEWADMNKKTVTRINRRDVEGFLESKYPTPLTLRQIAAALNVSPNKLNALRSAVLNIRKPDKGNRIVITAPGVQRGTVTYLVPPRQAVQQ